MIRVEDLSISFGDKKVIKNISLTFPTEKRTSIIGPNGCGKSTLLRAVAGINHKYQGNIFLKDENIKNIGRNELAKIMAILPQGATAPADLRVKDLVSYGRFPYKSLFKRRFAQSNDADDREIILEAMEKTNISHLSDRLVSTLSGGERQRAWIAMALAQQPKLLILDEPTTYLDIAHQLEVMQIVEELSAQGDITIIMVLHDMNHALLYSDEIVVLKDGLLYKQGAPQDILTRETLQEVFGVESEYYNNQCGDRRIIFPTGLNRRRE